jgi:hypothetical protein
MVGGDPKHLPGAQNDSVNFRNARRSATNWSFHTRSREDFMLCGNVLNRHQANTRGHKLSSSEAPIPTRPQALNIFGCVRAEYLSLTTVRPPSNSSACSLSDLDTWIPLPQSGRTVDAGGDGVSEGGCDDRGPVPTGDIR